MALLDPEAPGGHRRMTFDELLKTLQRDYLTSIPQKIEVIRKQMADKSVNDLRESFHKLKGTGRTYGIPEVSELAASIEEICIDFPDSALTAASHALELLIEIHSSRAKDKVFALNDDPRFAEIRKVLQD
jgi:HPt (histidine-containing phosphotransfer) domain-containing protein